MILYCSWNHVFRHYFTFSLSHIFNRCHMPDANRIKTALNHKFVQCTVTKYNELISSLNATRTWNEFDMLNYFSQLAKVLVPSLVSGQHTHKWSTVIKVHCKISEICLQDVTWLSVALQIPPIIEKFTWSKASSYI